MMEELQIKLNSGNCTSESHTKINKTGVCIWRIFMHRNKFM